MKNLILIAMSFLFLASTAGAYSKGYEVDWDKAKRESAAKVAKVRDKYDDKIMNLNGAYGIGTGACHLDGTPKDFSKNPKQYIYCITIYAHKNTVRYLEQKIGKAPADLDGVYVNYVRMNGPFEPYPGVTVRN